MNLSLGGKLMVIESVLYSFFIYALFVKILSICVQNTLNSLMSNFL